VIRGEVLTATFVETVLDSVFIPGDDDRVGLEVERDDLERQIGNLTTAVAQGGDIPSLVAELKITNGRLVDVRRRLEPREQHDREQLRAALDQRVEEWRQILRANPAQARQVVQHLVGPITLRVGEASDLDVATGANPKDRRGTEGISAADVRWSADTKPSGVIGGNPAGPTYGVPKGSAGFTRKSVSRVWGCSSARRLTQSQLCPGGATFPRRRVPFPFSEPPKSDDDQPRRTLRGGAGQSQGADARASRASLSSCPCCPQLKTRTHAY
jgi:hypothetical protein